MPRKARTYANECSMGCGGFHSRRHKAYRTLRRKNSKRNLFVTGNAAPAIQRLWRARRAAVVQNEANNALDNILAAVPRRRRRRGRRPLRRAAVALPAVGNVIA